MIALSASPLASSSSQNHWESTCPKEITRDADLRDQEGRDSLGIKIWQQHMVSNGTILECQMTQNLWFLVGCCRSLAKDCLKYGKLSQMGPPKKGKRAFFSA